jgi:hypothetical protein
MAGVNKTRSRAKFKIFGGGSVDMSAKEMHTEDPLYKGVPVKDISPDNLVEFKIMEDIDGVHIQPWGDCSSSKI